MSKAKKALRGALAGTIVIALALVGHGLSQDAAANRTFAAFASGDQVVEPTGSLALAHAVFQLSEDGTELHYRLVVANLEDLTMAHIHLAPRGENGPVVAWLYPEAPPPSPIEGRFDGELAEGTITAEVLAGPLEGMTLDDLVAEMTAGNTYVNIHTEEHGGGEIRGQIFEE